MKGRLELSVKQKRSNNDGFEELLNVHTQALEANSKIVVELLEVLSGKELSFKDKESLKKIKRELQSIDSKVDSLGVSNNFTKDEESWW